MKARCLILFLICLLLMGGSALAAEYSSGDDWLKPFTGTGGIATAEVIAKSVTMRDQPALSGGKVVSIPAEASLMVLDRANDDWVKATYTNDKGRVYTGYVRTAYIVINAEHITLRRSNTPAYNVPSREGKLLGSLAKLTNLPVTGEWGDYYVVWLRGGSAFIRKDADVWTQTELNALLESTWNSRLGGHSGKAVRACTLRTGPGEDWPESASLKAGAALDISPDMADGWMFVKTQKGDAFGYVKTEDVE